MRSNQLRETSGRIEFLDVVRGLAALSVVLCHYVMGFGRLDGTVLGIGTPYPWWCEGSAAVSLFFVLSGLVLSMKYFQSRDDRPEHPTEWAGFILGRICRIYLPYLIIAACTAWMWAHLYRHMETNPALTSITYLPWDELTRQTLPSQFNLMQHPVASLILPAWTLHVEFAISLLVPVAVLMAKRNPWWLVSLTVLAIFCDVIPSFALYFMFGIMIAMNVNRLGQLGRVIPFSWKLLVFAIGIALYSTRSLTMEFMHRLPPQNVVWFGTSFGSAMILCGCIMSRRAQRVLAFPVLTGLGKISYSVYLWHCPLLMAVMPYVMRFQENALHLDRKACWLIGLPIYLAMTMVLSVVSYRCIELPTIALGKQMRHWLRDGYDRQIWTKVTNALPLPQLPAEFGEEPTDSQTPSAAVSG